MKVFVVLFAFFFVTSASYSNWYLNVSGGYSISENFNASINS